MFSTSSPNQRRRAKRSSINNNSLLSTISTVHELMSFIIHKGINRSDILSNYMSMI